jgi:hypothetical protein
MLLPTELINIILLYNNKELYYDKLTNSWITRFTTQYFNCHPYNHLEHNIMLEEDLSVVRLHTGIERRGLRDRRSITEKIIVIEKKFNNNYDYNVFGLWIYSHTSYDINTIDYIENHFTHLIRTH